MRGMSSHRTLTRTPWEAIMSAMYVVQSCLIAAFGELPDELNEMQRM